jgi:hypothetical protein
LTRAAVCAWACALATLCLAGCGGGGGPKPLGKAAYDKQMTAIGKSLGAAFEPVAGAKTAHKAEVALVKVQGKLAAVDQELDAITPPSAVKTDQAHLVKAIEELDRELDPVVAKLKSGDLKALGAIDSLKGIKDLTVAVEAISTAGYNIGG